ALVNVMDQYHPDYACNPADPNYDPQFEELARRPHDREIQEAYDHAVALGLRFDDVTFEKA
ncbi:MAG: pyruvate formate lyase activating enzyme, partial [Candidatus Thermoplasmatota archaeon]|nr:pyruvate formate lyase activating enzyme [Candidatus Thermoplasmatota archaeon]